MCLGFDVVSAGRFDMCSLFPLYWAGCQIQHNTVGSGKHAMIFLFPYFLNSLFPYFLLSRCQDVWDWKIQLSFRMIWNKLANQDRIHSIHANCIANQQTTGWQPDAANLWISTRLVEVLGWGLWPKGYQSQGLHQSREHHCKQTKPENRLQVAGSASGFCCFWAQPSYRKNHKPSQFPKFRGSSPGIQGWRAPGLRFNFVCWFQIHTKSWIRTEYDLSNVPWGFSVFYLLTKNMGISNEGTLKFLRG